MDIKDNLAKNIILFRKHLGMTQAELADKLNYSDKAVSKWERGESIPDLYVVKEIADLFGTSVDALIAEPKQEKVKTVKNIHKKRIIICACSAALVWLVAVVVYSFMNMIYPPFVEKAWLAFILAMPVTFIVLLSLSAVWGKSLINLIFVSALIWTLIAATFITLKSLLNNPSHTLWMIFLIGIPLQVLTLLWFTFKKVK